jgi:hypothetical protein
MSKILFIGDSFTWGQGLYFYKWIEERRKLPNSFGPMYPSHIDLITEEDLKYKDTLSYTNLVASHYGSTQIKLENNGGSNTEHILELIKLLDNHRDEIDKVVFQFTAISRYQFRDLNLRFDDNYDGKFDELLVTRIKEFYNYIDGILSYHSKLFNFRYCYMDWLGDVYSTNPDNFVKFNVDGEVYTHFNQFLEKYKIDLLIDGKSAIDLHLNREGQTILSNSIISHFG